MNNRIIGIVLIALGVLAVCYTGFNYVTTKRVVDIGALQINHDVDHTVQWPPFVGAVLIVAGVVVLVTNKKGQA
jgi:hypothetical protein